jgi:hypothetical protein
MGTLLVVESEVGRQARLQLRHCIIVIDVDVFVFCAPNGGIGLGLGIASRAVELHQGRVTAFNASPGLVVAIELPCQGDGGSSA